MFKGDGKCGNGIVRSERYKESVPPKWANESNSNLAIQKECVSLLNHYRAKMNDADSEKDFHEARRTVAILEFAEQTVNETITKAKRHGKL